MARGDAQKAGGDQAAVENGDHQARLELQIEQDMPRFLANPVDPEQAKMLWERKKRKMQRRPELSSAAARIEHGVAACRELT